MQSALLKMFNIQSLDIVLDALYMVWFFVATVSVFTLFVFVAEAHGFDPVPYMRGAVAVIGAYMVAKCWVLYDFKKSSKRSIFKKGNEK